MSKKKQREPKWTDVLRYRKEIALAMAVSHTTNEHGVIVDNEVWQRNGSNGNSLMSSNNVLDILDYRNTGWLPQCWSRIIAEFAKPFVPGLTKKNAPGIREKYRIKVRREELRSARIKEKIVDKEAMREYNGEDVASVHWNGGENYSWAVKPVTMTKMFYVRYLQKKLSKYEFAEQFVKKNVVITKYGSMSNFCIRSNYTDKISKRYKETSKRYKEFVLKRSITLYHGPINISSLMCSRSLGDINKPHIDELIRTKASSRGVSLARTYTLYIAKYKNRLLLIV